jgi:murein DD-endopeptidase MepM/ murein hydrolase activator NlpD
MTRSRRAGLGISAMVVAVLGAASAASACPGGERTHGTPMFGHPVPGAVVSGYGPRNHPLLNLVRHHDGIDYAAAVGDPVHAAAAGEIVHAGWLGQLGIAVVIRHADGWETLYAHLARPAAGIGDCVKAGDMIGMAGTTGLSVGPALHFETRRHGAHVDPETLLAATTPEGR